MDARSLTNPIINDKQALEEFVEALNDLAPGIERDVADLRQKPDDREVIASLFRAFHNIKGDATLCKVELAVTIAHPIETLLARLRNGELAFSDILAETILLAIDRLELAVEGLRSRRSLDNLRLVALVSGLQRLADAAAADIDREAAELITTVTGFRPTTESVQFGRGRSPSAISKSPAQTSDDLRFFRSLADQLENRSPLFKGRTLRLLRLASETNQIRNKPVDPVQLEAAVYMHDIGMMFLPESTWLKVGNMTPDEIEVMHNHPGYGAGLLGRMPGWEAAAEMVAQHHEMPDGHGYPEGFGAERICDGAKILAIVDAFESVMLKHAHRGKNRSVLRAIAEVNACDNQFAKEWIEPFNQVIHRSVNA